MSSLEIVAAFVMGLMGSLHCAAMCGPIAAVVCARGGPSGLAPHAGRIATYSILGGLAGMLGSAIMGSLSLGLVQVGARILAALVLVVVGLSVAGLIRARVARLERIGGPLFRAFARAGGPSAAKGVVPAIAQGAVWGLVPCGLVYGALGLAVVSGSGANGALVMVAFGVGTLPVMIAVGLFAEGFRRITRDGRVRRAAGLLLACAGTLHLALAMQAGGALLSPRAILAPAADQEPARPPASEPRTPSCH